jgi:hypothetical protein
MLSCQNWWKFYEIPICQTWAKCYEMLSFKSGENVRKYWVVKNLVKMLGKTELSNLVGKWKSYEILSCLTWWNARKYWVPTWRKMLGNAELSNLVKFLRNQELSNLVENARKCWVVKYGGNATKYWDVKPAENATKCWVVKPSEMLENTELSNLGKMRQNAGSLWWGAFGLESVPRQWRPQGNSPASANCKK